MMTINQMMYSRKPVPQLSIKNLIEKLHDKRLSLSTTIFIHKTHINPRQSKI